MAEINILLLVMALLFCHKTDDTGIELPNSFHKNAITFPEKNKHVNSGAMIYQYTGIFRFSIRPICSKLQGPCTPVFSKVFENTLQRMQTLFKTIKTDSLPQNNK